MLVCGLKPDGHKTKPKHICNQRHSATYAHTVTHTTLLHTLHLWTSQMLISFVCGNQRLKEWLCRRGAARWETAVQGLWLHMRRTVYRRWCWRWRIEGQHAGQLPYALTVRAFALAFGFGLGFGFGLAFAVVFSAFGAGSVRERARLPLRIAIVSSSGASSSASTLTTADSSGCGAGSGCGVAATPAFALGFLVLEVIDQEGQEGQGGQEVKGGEGGAQSHNHYSLSDSLCVWDQ